MTFTKAQEDKYFLKHSSDLSRIAEIISSKQMVEHSDFDIYLFNPVSLKIKCVSNGMIRSTGYTKEELLAMSIADLSGEFNEAELHEIIKPLVEGRKKSLTIESKRRNKDGTVVAVTACIHSITDSDSTQLAAMVHEKVNDVNLETHNDIVSGLLSMESAATLIINAEMNIEHANQSLCHLLEKQPSEVIGQNISILVTGDDDSGFDKMIDSLTVHGIWHGVIWRSSKKGNIFPLWIKACKYQMPSTQMDGYILVLSDNSNNEVGSHFPSSQQTLTGLPNRNQFLEYADTHLTELDGCIDGAAIFHIDINNFKKVNELFGHNAGDEILVSVAERIESNTHRNDIVSNLAADEFAIFVAGITTREQASTIAERLINAFEVPFVYKGKNIRITVSIGVALDEKEQLQADAMLQNAEHAVNSAKKNGKSNYYFFSKDSISEIASKFDLESRLHQALINEEFELFFQPQFDLASGEIKSAEVLLRWNCPEQGLILPSIFIPVLEESELIIPVGKWIIMEACRMAKKWQDDGYKPIQVAVNVSALQFKNNQLIKVIKKALAETQLDPAYLEIEITESSLMADSEGSIGILNKISDMGIGISMDDFGTGYSSLSYLKKLPIDVLKIDQSFIRGIPDNNDDMAIIKAIVAMSKALNLEIVAEGVETQQQLDMLTEIGCEKIQGYLIGRPTPASGFEQFLES